MAKAPVPGEAKTRLAPPLTLDQAAALAQALLVDQLEHLASFRSAELYLVFAPAHAAATMAGFLPANFKMFPQRGDDLGARMGHAFAELWRRGCRRMVLIGGDLPPVPPVFFSQAFAFLAADAHRVVLGPSRDGGYYLVGMNKPAPAIFSGMAWSHDQVLARTTDRLDRLGIEFTLLPEWFDVDRPQDVQALRAIRDPTVRRAMKRTRKLLARLKSPKTRRK